MIISHHFKFIFIKTNKTAGTSIEWALSKFLRKGDMLTTIIEEEERQKQINTKGLIYLNKELSPRMRKKFKPHSPLSAAHKAFPETKDYFSFGILRNPFKRYISGFRYHKSQAIKRAINETATPDLEATLQHQFYQYIISDKGLGLMHKGRDLFNYCDTEGNHISINRILRLEDIEKTIESCLSPLGLNINPKDIPHLKSQFIKIPNTINLWSHENTKTITDRHAWEFKHLYDQRIRAIKDN